MTQARARERGENRTRVFPVGIIGSHSRHQFPNSRGTRVTHSEYRVASRRPASRRVTVAVTVTGKWRNLDRAPRSITRCRTSAKSVASWPPTSRERATIDECLGDTSRPRDFRAKFTDKHSCCARRGPRSRDLPRGRVSHTGRRYCSYSNLGRRLEPKLGALSSDAQPEGGRERWRIFAVALNSSRFNIFYQHNEKILYKLCITHIRKMLSTLLLHKKIIRGITSTLMRQDPRYVLSYAFLEYLYRRLQRMFEQNLCWITLPDIVFKRKLDDLEDTQNKYIDFDSCALANIRFSKELPSSWFHVCSMTSMTRYKLMIISVPDVSENTILISETMRHNLQNALHCKQLDESCFILPLEDDVVEFASEARISLIANPYDCATEMMDVMLENYFLHPRYLHVNDVFKIDAKEYAQDRFYLSGSPAICTIYFTVKSLKVDYHGRSDHVNDCYVVRGESTLIQEARVHDYIPRRHISTFPESRYPSVLTEPLEYLVSCVRPFLKKNVQLHVRPVFLVKGPRGYGKRELVRTASARMGLNFLCVDFAEVQTLTAAQTEAKLRITLHNAQQCVPCILYLNNIQIFGKTAEGQKDERIISAFSAEITTLYADRRRRFPLIIVAASETDLPAELQRIFIETIHVKHLNQNKRTELMSWLLSERNLTTTADLSRVSGLCSDFRFADLVALTLHAAKYRCKSGISPDSKTLTQTDFDRAYEYMQSIYSDSKGAPRVPEVHWDDIGGLAELKHEIIRRIQLPLLNAFGFGQSGLLLYGPPGTGKTLLAKAVATEYQLHFLSIKGPEVLNMYVGQSEKNVRQIFERARSAAPCIIFFDELDSLAPNRGRSGDSGGVMDRVVSQLLAEMDGLDESGGIFIIGATNRPDLIDPALLRPGRFDKMLYVGIHSDSASKLGVLQAQTRKFELRENRRELERVVDQLPDNVTGADLYSVSSNAWLNAVREVVARYQESRKFNKDFSIEEDTIKDSIIVELRHFSDAIRDLVPSVNDEEIERYNRMRTELSSS